MVVNQQMAAQQKAAQAQAAALQAAAVAGNQANRQGNPFWNMQGAPPMLAAGLPGNFYPQMQAFAAAQEQNSAAVGTVKLSHCKSNTSSNSSLVVRSSARKFNVQGGTFSVAQFTRKCVEENLEWLIKLSKRHFPEEKAVLLAYGDGCETLVLIDGQANKIPADFRKIKKIGVGVSVADSDSKLEGAQLAASGVLQPSDSVWEHLRFVETSAKKEKCLFIHTSITIWTDSVEARRRVLQVATASPAKPYAAVNYMPNPMFEQQVLNKWKEQGSAKGQAVTGASASEPETWINFNPKELILLEKAFDNLLSARDLKSDGKKFNEDDKKACQRIIKRANDEFVMRGPPRKRRKKEEEEAKPAAKKAVTPAKKAVTPAKKAATPAKKATPVKKEEKKPASPEKKAKRKSDAAAVAKTSPKKKAKKEVKKEESDDDAPLSKLKPKASTKTPAAKRSKPSTGVKSKTPAKAKTPEKSKSRGRASKGSSKKVETPKKSAAKKSRSKK